jgi:CheY-like chemotaxis protein
MLMTTTPLKIFVVDDDPTARMSTVFLLDDPAYEVTELENGEACLDAMSKEPDILLLDVEMSGTDGIAVCRALREAGNDRAQVIFISSHDDLHTRLAAFDAGGDDYMVKPYVPEELARKLKVAERALDSRRGLTDQASNARQVAFTAMSAMGEMGAVLEFLRASFACQDPAGLAQAVFLALGQYGLNGLLELKTGSEAHCFSSARQRCSPLEASILSHARGMERVFQFHDRLAVNYPHVTLLVPNMPLDDAERAGRLRDNLVILAEGTEARLIALEGERQRLAQGEGIRSAVSELTRVLEEIERRQADNRVRALEGANGYLQDLEAAFVHLGLTGNQEDTLLAMARQAMDQVSRLQDDGKYLGERLRETTGQLRKLAEA